MTRTLFFADKSVLFAGELPVGGSCDVILEKGTAVSRAKILKILETNNSVAILSDDPEGAFLRFAEEFLPVEAAGGIAVNGRGEWLMIHRNGRWDLPKGHLEPYEELPECAVREVAEETGIHCEVVRPLCRTYHAYNLYGKWELKRTSWYELHALDGGTPSPQTEEGIDRVAWCNAAEAELHLRDSFPTIRCVARAMMG